MRIGRDMGTSLLVGYIFVFSQEVDWITALGLVVTHIHFLCTGI